ncbi:hypothetical protein [Aminobacter ciceronei]|uniref:DUF3077 domain-containing protein n=1 Tax=Aminobacter ciceronei TaxID=150723 RepID=A0ABR6CFW5_9HYPH|nr:hypothetical protein [Aminobacter ciceronei]MBA8910167.1 hypothetical protein [Aminobacter ciceronei]MBA9023939.1 hypothetical protein [Aminobacter ciceronei]
MSRFIPHTDMSANDLMQCSYQAQAIISLCIRVGDDLSPINPETAAGADISQALVVALELVGVMHDALESHEGLKGGVR